MKCIGIHKAKLYPNGKLHVSRWPFLVWICLWMLASKALQAETAKSPVFYISPVTTVSNSERIHIQGKQHPLKQNQGVVYVSENTLFYAPKERLEVKKIPGPEGGTTLSNSNKKKAKNQKIKKYGPLLSKEAAVKSLRPLHGWTIIEACPVYPGSNRWYTGKTQIVGLCPTTQDRLSYLQSMVIGQVMDLFHVPGTQTYKGLTDRKQEQQKGYLLDTVYYLRPPPTD